MSERQTPESGLRYDRIGVIRESVMGEIPTDPNWEYHSDDYISTNWAPSPGATRRDALGTPDPTGHDVGNEEHELEVAYRLQQALVDGSGDPVDMAGDAFVRDADEQIPNTHGILARDERTTPSPEDPDDVQGARTYMVAKGGHPDASIEGDPEDGVPVPVELTYQFEKIRSYHILQPASGSTLAVSSTDDSDTMDIIIEDEGASKTETLTLNGTTSVTSTDTDWTDIDAVELTEEASGDVTVSIDGGSDLVTLRGAQHYSDDDQDLEGDLGVPALGGGSHPTEIGTAYEHFIGDSVQRNSADIAYDLNNVVLEVDNNYDTTTRHDSVRMRINEGNRDVTFTADVVGEKESHDYIMESLTAGAEDITWSLSNTIFNLNSSSVTDPPDRTRESEDAAAAISVGFRSEDPQVVQA
jgi:hypothetical protein